SRFGYTGAIKLPGTDLLHMRARVYATELARFLEPDPIGFASGQLNLYAYVGNDPVNAVDPLGTVEEELEEIVVTTTPPAFEDTLAGLLYESMARANELLRSTLADPLFGSGPGGGTLPGEGGMMGEEKRCGKGSAATVVRATDEERLLLARTIFAEAAQDFDVPGAFEGIGFVIINRLESRLFPNSIHAVINMENAFEAVTGRFVNPETGEMHVGNDLFRMSANPASLTGRNRLAFMRAVSVADAILSGSISDPTGGATFFFPIGRPIPSFFRDRLASGRLTLGPRIGHTQFVCDTQEK
ncbi:MAG: hypothetical protein D6694_07130, partial [Gammaproteobacteria bacterium]